MQAAPAIPEVWAMEPLRIDLGAEDFVPLFVSPDSQRLFARSWSRGAGTLKVCSLQAAEVPEVIEDPGHSIEDAALLGANQMVVLLYGGLVKLIDLETYKTIDVDFLRVGEYSTRLSSSDGTRMAIGYTNHPRI